MTFISQTKINTVLQDTGRVTLTHVCGSNTTPHRIALKKILYIFFVNIYINKLNVKYEVTLIIDSI